MHLSSSIMVGFINDAGSNSLPHQGDNNSIPSLLVLNMLACVMIGYRLTSSSGKPFKNNNICSVGELKSCALSSPNSNTKARTENTRISKPKKQPRRVHFAESVHDVQIIPRKTADEIAEAWYTKLDIALFKLGEREDATLLRYTITSTNNSLDELLTKESVSIYRGLERLLSSQIVAEINKRRLFVVKSVILEQALQRRYLKTDVLRIAKVSKKYSEKATLWARTLGSL